MCVTEVLFPAMLATLEDDFDDDSAGLFAIAKYIQKMKEKRK